MTLRRDGTRRSGGELEMDFLRWAGHPGGVWLVQLPRLWMEEGWGEEKGGDMEL